MVNGYSLLSCEKAKVRAELQYRLLQIVQDRCFKILLTVSIFQLEKIKKVRIPEYQICAYPVLIAQSRQFPANEVAGFPADRSSFIQ